MGLLGNFSLPDPAKALSDAMAQLPFGGSALVKNFVTGLDDLGLPHKTTKIQQERWNQLHTYAFQIHKAGSDGSVPEKFDKQVKLQLPPSSISISIPFAMNVTATNRGVNEQSNGIVFRHIAISGTTGILPTREIASAVGNPLGIGPGFLANSLGATFGALNTLVKTTKSIFATDQSAANNVEHLLKYSGYYQFWKLTNFFIEYAESKKLKGSKDLRLVFSCPKDNINYVCTPIQFDLKRDASSPLLYKYSIVLKCWDITTASSAIDDTFKDGIPNRNNITSIKDIAERIRRGRMAIQQAGGVLQGVQSDINDVFGLVNQSALAIKDIVGLGATLIDFLPTLKANAQLMVRTTGQQFNQAVAEFDASLGHFSNLLTDTNPTSDTNADSFEDQEKLRASAALDGSAAPQTSKISGSPNGEKADGEVTQSGGNIKLMRAVLNDPEAADAIAMSALGEIPPAVQEQIDDQIEEAASTSAGDIREVADKLQELSDNLAANNGSMSVEYAQLYGLPTPLPDITKEPTEDDIILAAQIQDLKAAFASTLASGNIFLEKDPNPFTSANDMLSQDDQIITPSSTYPVVMERGASLERMAYHYLKDANRAKEIAILNNLRAPYVDEVGFSIGVASASGRTFIVNENGRLTLSQSVLIQGTGQASTKRRILAIEDVGGSKFKVTVDGKADLDRFAAASSPFITARLPGTVGSGDIILIPSTDSPDENDTTKPSPLSSRLSHAEKVFKIDMAIDGTNDLAIGANGDVSRAYGYQNALQALKILVETEIGELEQHPEFGIPVKIGQTNTELSPDQIVEAIRMAVLSDPRFTDADVSITVDGSIVRVRVDAKGQQGTGRIPVDFVVDL